MRHMVLLSESIWADERRMKGRRRSWEYMGIPYVAIGIWARVSRYTHFSTSRERHARRPGDTAGEPRPTPLSLYSAAIATRHPRKANFEEEVGRFCARGALYADESNAFRRHLGRSPNCGRYRMCFNRAVVGENTTSSNLSSPTDAPIRGAYRIVFYSPSFTWA